MPDIHPVTAESSPADLMAYINFLERRLECDATYGFRAGDGDLEEVRIPLDPAGRLDMIRSDMDGIGTRDETIRMLEETRGHLVARTEEMSLAMAEISALIDRMPDHYIATSLRRIVTQTLKENGSEKATTLAEAIMTRAWVDGLQAGLDIVESARCHPASMDFTTSRDLLADLLREETARHRQSLLSEPVIMRRKRADLVARARSAGSAAGQGGM